jgi:hypothetical protein
VELETDHLEQICLEVDETIERESNPSHWEGSHRSINHSGQATQCSAVGCVEVHAEDGVCSPQRRYQGTDGGFEGQEKSIRQRGGKIDTDGDKLMHQAVARKKMMEDAMKATTSTTESVGTTATGENNDETMVRFMQFISSTM